MSGSKLPFRKTKLKNQTVYICDLGNTRLIAESATILDGGEFSYTSVLNGNTITAEYSLNIPAQVKLIETEENVHIVESSDTHILIIGYQVAQNRNSVGKLSVVSHDIKASTTHHHIFDFKQKMMSSDTYINNLQGVIINDSFVTKPNSFVTKLHSSIEDSVGFDESDVDLVYGSIGDIDNTHDSFVADTLDDMIALIVKKGDRCYRVDLATSFINITGKNDSIADWEPLSDDGVSLEVVQAEIALYIQPMTNHIEKVTGNPHNVTKAEVGLALVPNIDFTSRIEALEQYDGVIIPQEITDHITTVTGNPHQVTKAEVGLSDVPNHDFTDEVNANTAKVGITQAQADAIVANTTHAAITTGNPHHVTKAEVGLALVPNIDFSSIIYLNEDARHNHTNKSILDSITAPFTTDLLNKISANSLKIGITPEQSAAIVINSSKVSITQAQADAIVANTAKVGITPEQIVSIVASDAHITTVTGNPHNVTKEEIGLGLVPNHDFTDEVNANTAKVGITQAQADAIVANTAKVGITQAQADAIVANTAKVGITQAQADAIVANTTKVGITQAQADAIVANTAKVGITQAQADAIILNNNHRSLTSGNPHHVTKIDIGLSNVPNVDFTTEVNLSDIHRQITSGNPHQVTKADVGLSEVPNVDFTAEVNANTAHATIVTGNPHQVTKAEIGLDLVPNVDCTNASNITTGTLPSSVLPPLAISETFVVIDEVAQLALIVQKGDIAVRSDENKTYINITGNNSSMDDWQELSSSNTILSVNGQTGTVVLTTTNIAEGTNLYYTEARVSANSNVALNTANRHNHTNKTILDATTASFTNEQADAILINAAKIGITLQQIDSINSADNHIATITGNPHQVTKADVGLNNVPNVDFTTEVNTNTAKVGITPEQAAAIISNSFHSSIISGNPHQVTKAEVGLGNVPNIDFTVDVAANTAHTAIITGNPHQVTKAEVGLSEVPNHDFTAEVNDNTAHTAIITGNPHQVTKAEVGLGSVPNHDFTAEVAANTAKVGITVEQTASIVASDAHITTVTGNPHQVTKAEVGLSEVPNVDCTNASNITTGTLPSSVLPPLAITDTFVVANETAQLELVIQKGDIAIRTDEGKSYINATGNNSSMDDWQELLTPTDTILSVNGQTGTVVLTTTNIAEGTNLYYTETRVSSNVDVAANTANRHNHANKTILDGTEESFTTILLNDINKSLSHSNTISGNPHNVTKAEVGLGLVPNHDFTAEVNANTAHTAIITRNPHQVTKADVGLGLVPNHDFTAEVAANTAKVGITPEQAAAIIVNTDKIGITQEEIDSIIASNLHSSLVSGNPHNVTKAEIGLGNVPNYDFTTEVQINNAKVGITSQQSFDITLANAHREIISGNPHNVTKTDIGLSNVPNHDFTDEINNNTTHTTIVAGNPHQVTKAEVGLGNVPNVDCTNASNITTGTLPSSVLPPLAITDIFVVVDEVAQLTLTVQKGDIAIRTDEGKSYINATGDNTAMTDWQELLTPTDTILSVNGQTGTVVLTTTNIAEGTNLYYTEARVSANVDVAANTTNRHNHANKAILDATTASFTNEQAASIITNTAKVGITPEQITAIIANTAHTNITSGNPHQVTKADVGLNNVPNVDFTTEVAANTAHTTIVTGNPHQVTKAEVGLGLVQNHDFTNEVTLNTIHSSTVTGNPHQVTKAEVGLGNVPNHDFTDEVNANTSARHTHSNKTALDSVSGINTGDQTNITGNAGTATKLAVARTINNVPFDGSSNITIPVGDVTLSGTQTLLNKVLESVILNNGVTEQVSTMTDNVLQASNGSILLKSLSANSVFTDNLSNGQSITLILTNASSYTVAWPTTTWVSYDGNIAPVIYENNVLVFWKIGSVLYGTFIGSF
jgi:uncharacterized protein YpmB